MKRLVLLLLFVAGIGNANARQHKHGNIGLGYKLLFYQKTRRDNGFNKMYLLLEAKYNYVNYQSAGVPAMEGNSVSLNLSLRFMHQWWLAGERP